MYTDGLPTSREAHWWISHSMGDPLVGPPLYIYTQIYVYVYTHWRTLQFRGGALVDQPFQEGPLVGPPLKEEAI